MQGVYASKLVVEDFYRRRNPARMTGLLKNWRETTAYAGDDDFLFGSDRLKGKQPRVPNMLVEDHLRSAAKQVIEIPHGHRLGSTTSGMRYFVPGRDWKRLQGYSGHAALGRPVNPAQGFTHSRMEAQAKMMEAMRLTEEDAQRLIQ